MEIRNNDWSRLARLMLQVGLAPERIDIIRKRLEGKTRRPGSPYTLLIGSPESGIEIVLEHWIGPHAKQALLQCNDVPLIIGPQPDQLRFSFTQWPVLPCDQVRNGHVLALRTPKLTGSLALQLEQAVGYCESGVLVLTMAQLMDAIDRKLARALASLAVTVRALVIGIPELQPRDRELQEVLDYVDGKLAHLCWSDERRLGTGIWFIRGDAPPGTLKNTELGTFITPPADFTHLPLEALRRYAFASVLAETYLTATSKPPISSPPDQPQISAEERERLMQDFRRFLDVISRDLEERLRLGSVRGSEMLHYDVLSAFRYAKAASDRLENIWIRELERLRPGAYEDLLEQVEQQVNSLELPEPGTQSKHSGWKEWLSQPIIRWSLQLLLALFAGLLTYRAALWLLRDDGFLAGILVSLLSYSSLLLGGLLAFLLLQKWWPAVPKLESGPTDRPYGPTTEGTRTILDRAVPGWHTFRQNLESWFFDYLGGNTLTIAEQCKRLAERCGVATEFAKIITLLSELEGGEP
ncbi:MAG: hypothetical protein RML93_07875 [Anaerolineales bacterium]|nr:hypothetical protein [Anaerolineales bacterium]MCS7160289.1 hypothetical protein [Gemmatales bacterium]MDW8175489.1 hypothetical protein [Gemmatales bacterium]MDW8447192.1 hypothetical protein [Anaerolineales bacterium]